MLGMKIKPHVTVAGLVDKACKGFGTNELLLTTVLIRFQKILKEVMVAHVEEYGQSIEDRVRSETGGDYEKVLLAICETATKL